MQDDLAELEELGHTLYRHCALVYVNTCDMSGIPRPDKYVWCESDALRLHCSCSLYRKLLHWPNLTPSLSDLHGFLCNLSYLKMVPAKSEGLNGLLVSTFMQSHVRFGRKGCCCSRLHLPGYVHRVVLHVTKCWVFEFSSKQVKSCEHYRLQNTDWYWGLLIIS